MLRYEILMLAVPTITQDETKTIESSLDKIFKENKATMVSFERWGKYRLAYPVKKNDYGVYFLVRFEAEDARQALEDIRTLFKVKLHEIIMRYVPTVLDPENSLVYQRPQSLEEEPARDRSEKNKIERILSTTKSRSEETAVKEDSKEELPEAVATEEVVEEVSTES